MRMITIVGGWGEDVKNEWNLRGSHDELAKACEDIGRELARNRQAVIVGGEGKETADYHIVKGIVETAGAENVPYPLVHVIRPESGEPLFQDFWRAHRNLFTPHPRTQRRPEGAKIIAVHEADAVLTIGGMEATYHAGLAAIISRKTLVPIPSFGGASSQLLDALEKFGDVRNLSEFGALDGPWSPDVPAIALRLSGIMKLKLFVIHGHGDDWSKLENWLSNQDGLPDVIVMKEEFGKGLALPEKFESLASKVDAAIAIATPDDLGRLNTEASTDQLRARQNVWLEVGWFWGRLGRKRVMVLHKGEVEIPSDLLGVETYPYNDHPSERGDKIHSFINLIQRGE